MKRKTADVVSDVMIWSFVLMLIAPLIFMMLYHLVNVSIDLFNPCKDNIYNMPQQSEVVLCSHRRHDVIITPENKVHCHCNK